MMNPSANLPTLSDLGMPTLYILALAGLGVRSIGAFAAMPEQSIAGFPTIGAALVPFHRLARGYNDRGLLNRRSVSDPIEMPPDNVISLAAERARRGRR